MSELAGPSHVTVVTGMECCEFTYEWTIENFKESYGRTIESPSFSSHYCDFDDEWILEIYSALSHNKRDIHMVASLKLQSFNNTSQLQTKCKISTNDKYEIIKENNFSKFSKTVICDEHMSILELLGKTNGSCEINELKICCTITMFKKLTNNFDEISIFNARQQLREDWKKLLLNEKTADVTIQVGQKSFRAIKGILGARSPVFAAMFDHEQLKENVKNEVVIEDIDEDVFEEFLHYIYTGESPNIDKMPKELRAVADKYQVNCLKNICEDVIGKMINFDNVASILVYSDGYNLKKLNEKCLEFMKKNLRAVMSNETFQVEKKKYPEIFVGVLEHLLLS